MAGLSVDNATIPFHETVRNIPTSRRYSQGMLLFFLACSDHGMHPIPPAADPLQYQTAVLEFMCTHTCAWQDEATCWDELSAHWGFCLEGSEVLDSAQAEDCLRVMDTEHAADECRWLPEECTVYAVALSARSDGEGCQPR